MSPAQPLGDPAPLDGRIPTLSAEADRDSGFSLYIHVPFCSVRCGYCDFNTYATEDFGGGVSLENYAADAITELEFAADVLRDSGFDPSPVRTVFFGGGTPTKLPADDLVKILHRAADIFGLADGAEITTEANPDSVTADDIQMLADGGFNRISFGMQSVVPQTLAVLDRTHSPANVPRVVEQAKQAGLQVSLDLIYGTPGETLEQWQQSVEAAVSYQPDHISAYSLIVEEGTKLWAQIRRGDYHMPDDDVMADMYLAAERTLVEHGYHWYEISNYSRSPANRSRHNLAYWQNHNWWGIGPGAHSHVNGTRWWNLKHPLAYAHRVRSGQSPAAAREILSKNAQDFETVMLSLRTVDGLLFSVLEGIHGGEVASKKLKWLYRQGLLEKEAFADGRAVLTLRGRLLGDAVTRELLPD